MLNKLAINAVAAGLLVVACTGCLREPFHGKVFDSRLSDIQFMGLWPVENEIVDVQVQDPSTGQWITIDLAVTGGAPTKGYYAFSVYTRIPAIYWTKVRNGYSCEVRTWTQKSGAMQTFNAGFMETAALSLNDPALFMELHHHGRSATIYAEN